MIVLGLTGSIGMGKSTASRMLRRLGVPVHESDTCVHRLLAPHGKAVAEVVENFPTVANGQGGVDRKALGRIIFANDQDRQKLEKILHPLVVQSQHRFLCRETGKGRSIVALDIPLLYETGAQRRVDFVIVVTAPAFVQRTRMHKRGMTDNDFEARLARQMPDSEKRRRADFVVQTGHGLAYTLKELKIMLRRVRKEKA